MNLGADDYLGKPFTRDDVLDAVQARIRRVKAMEKERPNGVESTGPVQVKGYRIIPADRRRRHVRSVSGRT